MNVCSQFVVSLLTVLKLQGKHWIDQNVRVFVSVLEEINREETRRELSHNPRNRLSFVLIKS